MLPWVEYFFRKYYLGNVAVMQSDVQLCSIQGCTCINNVVVNFKNCY